MKLSVPFDEIKTFGKDKAIFLAFIRQNPNKKQLEKLKEIGFSDEEIKQYMIYFLRDGFLLLDGSQFIVNHKKVKKDPKEIYKSIQRKKKEIEKKINRNGKYPLQKNEQISNSNEQKSYSTEDKAKKLIQYWNSLGIIKHNRGSNVYKKSLGALSVYLKDNMPMEKIKRQMSRYKAALKQAQLFPVEDYFIPLNQFILFEEKYLFNLSKFNKKAYNIYYNIPHDSILESSLEIEDDDEFIDLFSRPAPKDKTGLSKEIENSYLEFMEKRGKRAIIKEVQKNMFVKIGKKLKLFTNSNLDLIEERYLKSDPIKTAMILANFIFDPFENTNNFRLFYLLSDNFWQIQFIDFLYERGIVRGVE